MLKNLFSFLFQRSAGEERVAQYILREHARGRSLREILTDHFVQNRLETPEQRARLLMLARADLIKALSDQDR